MAPDVAAASCDFQTNSTIPHVRFVFGTSSSTFTLAQAASGISIPYDLVVDQDVPGFVPEPSRDGSDAANLTIGEGLAGNGQRYCICDTGLSLALCPTGDGGTTRPDGGGCEPVTIPHGTYHRTFEWDGHNWDGPSDTGNPKGAFFPAGDYVLTITTGAGSISDAGALHGVGTMHIILFS
jgi:hypothetical protein